MSEVQKFNCMLLHGLPCMMPKEEGLWVQSFDYDAAQSQLAALREELARANHSFDELAEIVGFSEDRLNQTGDSPMDCARQLQQRLADAERRNADQLQELVRAHGLIEQASNFRASTFSDCSDLILSLQAFVAETKSTGEYVAVRRDLLNLVCHGYVQEQGHALNRLRDQIAALNPNPEAASHDEQND